MKIIPAIFEEREIRRIYDETSESWFFSVVDIVQVLTQQPDYKAARNYWKVLTNRLGKEGSQLVTNCNQLKLPSADGKSYLTDVANAETLLRLVQSVPSPKAEPIKLWLAKLNFSSRAHDRILEVARTLADLEGTPDIRPNDILEPIQYRSLDRKLFSWESAWGFIRRLFLLRTKQHRALKDSRQYFAQSTANRSVRPKCRELTIEPGDSADLIF